MLLVYTTFPDQKTALKICNQLAREKLIACANINDIESRYIWEGEIMESKEVTGFLKTTCGNFSELRDRLIELHPYERPCVIRIKAEANRDYFDWLNSVVK
jgi:periplasmic divalent cation tolerance protein